MLEKEVEKPVGRWCKKLNIRHNKMNTRGHNHLPDRIYWIPGGRPFFIEYKRPGEEPRAAQVRKCKDFEELGYDVEIHDNADHAKIAILERIERATVEAPRLSKEGHKILTRARRGRLIPGSGAGENKHKFRRNKGS
jgi:hypothetical protein